MQRNIPQRLQTFGASYEKDQTQEVAIFYLAMSQLAQKDRRAAIPLLQKLLPESAFKESAEWYLALAYLLDEQRSSSKELLEKIKQDRDHSYQAQAKEIWNSL